MATTLRDIALELDISTALVSRVLNEKPGVWASPTTKARILETAQRLNYRPSTAARALVTGKTMLLAVSAADADWHRARSGRLAEMSGLIDAAESDSYRVLVLPSAQSHADKSQFEMLVRSHGCDGFCLYAEQADARLYQFLGDHEMPFVVIGNPGDVEVPRVDHDNFALYHDSVAWLASQNRRNIVLIEPARTEADAAHPESPFREVQRAGYRAAMREIGVHEPFIEASRPWTEADIVTWMRQKQPDALILTGLAATLQWKFALARAGMQLPDDVLIVSHLDLTEVSYLKQGALHEGVACHVHDPHAVGKRAGETLIRWINGQPRPTEPIFVPGHAPDWC